jgi:hypothetical protein
VTTRRAVRWFAVGETSLEELIRVDAAAFGLSARFDTSLESALGFHVAARGTIGRFAVH